MSYTNSQYSDLLRAVNQYGSMYNYGDPSIVNPYSGAAYSPASYREIMSRKKAPVDPRSAFTDYKPGFAESLATGAMGYQMGSQGLEPMAKGIYSSLAQGPKSYAGSTAGLTLGSTIYGATRDMNPYEVSPAEEFGNVLGPAAAGWTLGGMISTGAMAGPIGAGVGLLAGLLMNKAQKKKAEEKDIEAEAQFQKERGEYTEDIAKEFEEQREQYALGTEADLWGQEASKYSNQYGAYANPYGQSYYDKGGKLTNKEKDKLKKLGRKGDSELAHVNPQEKAMLQAMGGSDTINPYTGLSEYHRTIPEHNPKDHDTGGDDPNEPSTPYSYGPHGSMSSLLNQDYFNQGPRPGTEGNYWQGIKDAQTPMTEEEYLAWKEEHYGGGPWGELERMYDRFGNFIGELGKSENWPSLNEILGEDTSSDCGGYYFVNGIAHPQLPCDYESLPPSPRLVRDSRQRRPEDKVNVVNPFQASLGQAADKGGDSTAQLEGYRWDLANPYIRENVDIFNKGGKLAKLKKLGRRGDTELAYVNPQEKNILKTMGGSDTINPYTGLREYHTTWNIGHNLDHISDFATDTWEDIKNIPSNIAYHAEDFYDWASGDPSNLGNTAFGQSDLGEFLHTVIPTPRDINEFDRYWLRPGGGGHDRWAYPGGREKEWETVKQGFSEMGTNIEKSLGMYDYGSPEGPGYSPALERGAKRSSRKSPKDKVNVVNPFGSDFGQMSDEGGQPSAMGLEDYRWDLANPYIRENVDIFDEGGKLAKLKKLGRRGDTELAHVNPQEAQMLKQMGGSGTINPYTGLREYGWLSDAWDDVKGFAQDVWDGASDWGQQLYDELIPSGRPGLSMWERVPVLFNTIGDLRDPEKQDQDFFTQLGGNLESAGYSGDMNWTGVSTDPADLPTPEPKYQPAQPRLARGTRNITPQDKVKVVDPFGQRLGQASDKSGDSTMGLEDYRWDLANPYIRENVDIFDEGGVVNQSESLPVDSMFNRQLFAESSFNPSAESSAGALGLSQITEPTFNDMIGWGWVPEGKEFSDLKTDTDLAVNLQERYMNDLMTREWNQGSEDVVQAKALAAYNMGPTALVRVLNKEKEKGTDIYNTLDWVNNLPNYKKGYKETTNYVNKIMLGGSEKFEKDYTKSWKAGGKDYDQGGKVNTVAEFTGNELIINNQAAVEAGIKENNPSKAAAPIRLAMKKGFVTPGQETHGGNPMPVDDKGFIYTKGGKLPFRVRKGAGIYDHATDQFKQDMTDEQIMAVAKKNMNKWEKNNMN